MGLIEAVLGEVSEAPLPQSSIVRRVERRHRLARWTALSVERTVRRLKVEGRLRFVGQDEPGFVAPGPASCMSPVPLELASDGLGDLRSWIEEEPQPPTVRDDLLLQVAGSDEDDLPILDALVRDRLCRLTDLADEIEADNDVPLDAVAIDKLDWQHQRVLVARALDLSIIAGTLRGLRRAHGEIVEAMERYAEQRG